jgi:hypothetical protein
MEINFNFEAFKNTLGEIRQEDLDLELQGVYRNDKAKEMACFRDSFAECNPYKCMAWRRVDEDHGYCIVVGCSWRDGLILREMKEAKS